MDNNIGEVNKIFHIPKYKKFWYSCTKFEKYPEMASEGVGRAFSYLAWLIFIFGLVIAICLAINCSMILKQEVKFLDENFSEITYSDGQLTLVTSVENSTESPYANLIINTNELSEDQIKEYENSTSNKPEFIWLKDRVLVKIENNTFTYIYKDVLNGFNIKEFDKATAIQYLTQKVNSPQIYIIFGIAMLLYTFVLYFISTLLDIVILSLFGILTSLIAGIKIRYRAIFNMTVYAFTISTFLRMVYIIIGLFTDFNIKYFDLMYTTIAFICLAAAIFMIKSDMIKQQIELMRIIEIKKKEEEEQKEEKKDDKEDKKEDNKEDNKEEKKEGEKDKNEKEGLETGPQGGEA